MRSNLMAIKVSDCRLIPVICEYGVGAVPALAGKLVTAQAAALPAMALVALTAVVSHHVQLSAAQWLAMLAAMGRGASPWPCSAWPSATWPATISPSP
jgi:hypothetical protein